MSNAFDKLAVLGSFIEEVNSYLPEIETNLERLAQSPGDMDVLEETYRRTHTIGGSASMMDFPGLAHVAHGMEDILGDVLDGLTALDTPTIGLLQRSLERVRQLLRGIHQGIDENAIIAEDDADYTQYRMMMESKALSERKRDAIEEQSYVSPNPQRLESPMPSLDEMLASFRTPIVAAGEEVAWPEDPVPTASFESYADQSTRAEAALSPGPEPETSEQSKALDVPIAAAAQQPTAYSSSPVMPTTPAESLKEVVARTELQPSSEGRQTELAPASVGPEVPFSTSFNKMQEETRALEVQATSFRNMLAQLHQAVLIVEVQRTEFRSFLDGSKDALDRMEEWAGQAMGLNLRNSPEQVRRYLPLSVMWVVNSKLKKILELLSQITNGAVATDEQMHTALQELETAMVACGSAFQQAQADMSSRLLRQEHGWTPWEMRVSHEAGAVQERVTFERRGDPVVLRAEVETQVREELRHEYESRPFTQAARAELERQIRGEVLQELEAKRQLQERLSGSEKRETIQEIEARLRHEIEIQVRRDFLDQLTARVIGEEAAQAASHQPAPVAPSSTSTVASQTREPGGVDAVAPISTQQSTVAFAQNLSSTQPGTRPTTTDLPSTSTSAPLSTFESDFGEEVIELFRLEAEEHLQAISMRVAALENSPTDRDLIQGIRRATHTLKGAAGMMGFRVIADLCHISEDLLDSVMEGTTTIGPAVLSIVLDTAEALDVLITGGEKESANGQAMVQALRARYIELLGEHRNVAEEELDTDIDTDEESAISSSPTAEVVDDTRPAEVGPQRAARGDLSVRVRLQKLDELVNLFGELLVNRSILEERVERLVRLVADVGISSARLRDVGQKLETRFEAATLPSGRSLQVVPGNGNQSALYSLIGNAEANRRDLTGTSHLAEFDELELDRYTEFHQLTRGLSEGISDMLTLSNEMEGIIRECEGVFARESRLSNTFQDRLLKARLVPLSTMKPRLYRAARSMALKQQKEFEFLVEGEATEIDRTVSEEIAGPLLHLVRNAVNHGIETPEVRRQKGKSPVGQIKLSAAYESNQVVITVRDDGTGIDSEGVRNAAISHGFIKPDQQLHDNDLIGLIFQPGFTTSGVLSEESGRGVGLDVVRDSVARLRGTLEVESMPGQGTAFTMKFPTSLAIQSAMIVNAGGEQFAIPMIVVEAIGRLDTFKRSIVGGRPTILVQNESYPVTMLAQLLGLSTKILGEKAQLLLVNAGGHKVALVVDEIKGRLDVVMKNLGPHLRHVRGVAGGTVLGNGRVVLILELVDLISARPGVLGPTTLPTSREGMAVSQGAARSGAAVALAPDRRGVTVFTPSSTRSAAPERGKYILVVDDSPSVRRVVSNMLKQRGWQVQMARDGVEALEMITNETPAAVLLDIEMPRMDGYELMATVRAQDLYRTLPLVILTSRAAAKHQQRAMQLGANAYVVKPYQDEELINTLNALVYGAATT
jgi:chemotaxis protein histidine kinase CheA/ActR/RegA family two-component response regulator